jgi:hypothetical protein
MAGIGKFKLSDALRPPLSESIVPKGDTPKPDNQTTAEQTREANESEKAKGSGGSIRDRMVRIGRGNQQSGRQGQ